jgi:hypothetical protein
LSGSTSKGTGVPLLFRSFGTSSTIRLLSVSATHKLSAGLHHAGDAVPQAAIRIAIAAIRRNENAADWAELRWEILNICMVASFVEISVVRDCGEDRPSVIGCQRSRFLEKGRVDIGVASALQAACLQALSSAITSYYTLKDIASTS